MRGSWPRRDRIFRLMSLAALAGSVGSAAAGSVQDAGLLKKVRAALEIRATHLEFYSVKLANRMQLDLGGQALDFDNSETHFFGPAGEFRREGGAARGGLAARRARGAGRLGNAAPAALQRTDLLLQQDFLSDAEVVGPVQLEGVDTVELELKPKLPNVRIRKARLWVDPATGMPLRLAIEFEAGAAISDGKLTRDYGWGGDEEITLPRRQDLQVFANPGAGRGGFGGGRGGDRGGFRRGQGGIDVGGFGGGVEVKVATTWSDYQWNLSFDADFFTDVAPSGRGRRTARQPQAADPEDPFEEIRIAPESTAGRPVAAAESGSGEFLVQGGAVDGAAGRAGGGQGNAIARLIAAGGFGGGRGGLRGARIGGSRANRVQGSVTAGFSSSALDARPYALDGRENEAPDYLTWNAGVALGGPIRFGDSGQQNAFGRRGGASWFVDFNVRRGDQLQSRYGNVPTALERQGDFSQTVFQSGPLAGQPVRLFDPTTGQPIPDATLPALNPAAVRILEFVPLPNRGDPSLNYYHQQNVDNLRDRLNVRFNFSLPADWRVSAAYNVNRTGADVFNLFPDLTGDRTGRGQNLSANFNKTLGPGFVNSLRLRWNRNRNRRLNPFGLQTDISAELGIENTSPAPIDWGLPTIQLTNYSSINDGTSSQTIRERNTINDTLRWVRGRHSYQIGGEIGWNRWNLLGNPNGAGSQNYAGIATSLFVAGKPARGTGYDLADFLLGQVQSSRIQYGNSDHYLRRPEVAVFINDNWRLASRMTLQLGLRYQYVAPWVERYDRIASLDVAPGFTAAETVVPGSVGSYSGEFPRALVRPDANNFAPRIALAYRLSSGRRASVLRASYGIFFPNESYNYFADQLIAQPPFGFTVQQTAQGTDFLELETAFAPELQQDVANTYAVDPRFRLATVQTWNFSLQQSLPYRFFVSIGYAGTRGTGLELLRAPNRIVDGEPQIGDAAEFLYLTPGASSSFHGLQLLVTRRLRAGFTFNAQYEFGKSLDNASTLTGGNRTVAQDDSNLRAEKGRSSFDERHRLRFNWLWELPFGDRHRWFSEPGFFSTLLGGWFLTGRVNATSGRPFTAVVRGNQVNNSGTSSQASERADVTGEPVSLPASVRNSRVWFNTAAFALPVPGTFGNSARNTIDGPGSWTVDVNLARSIPLKGDNQRLLVTLRAANVLNHVNFTGLDTVVNSTGFGRVTSTGRMRRIQLDFRFLF